MWQKYLPWSLFAILSALTLSACRDPYNIERPGDARYAPIPIEHMQAPQSSNGSIYQEGWAVSLFDDQRAYRVGDILTVLLTETTQASKSADTKMAKNSTHSLPNPTLLGAPVTAGAVSLATNIKGEQDFAGTGTSKQSNQLQGTITVHVAQVLPNHHLVIRGEKWLMLNTGEEYIRLTGIVRPEDIATDNTVPSTRIADARISYGGEGAMADSNKMGWLSRFFVSKLWPL